MKHPSMLRIFVLCDDKNSREYFSLIHQRDDYVVVWKVRERTIKSNYCLTELFAFHENYLTVGKIFFTVSPDETRHLGERSTLNYSCSYEI